MATTRPVAEALRSGAGAAAAFRKYCITIPFSSTRGNRARLRKETGREIPALRFFQIAGGFAPPDPRGIFSRR
jgi:sirohydrochlorin ferrochelatase